jgi:hypothetical protein
MTRDGRLLSRPATRAYPAGVLRLALSLVALALCSAGCGSQVVPTPSDVDSGTTLLRQHGWQPIGVVSRDLVRIGDPAVVPDHVWELYLDVSRDIGLDFGPLRGQEAMLTRVDLGGPGATLLSIGEEVVGAWIFAGGPMGCVPGIFALSAPRAEVEGCAMPPSP